MRSHSGSDEEILDNLDEVLKQAVGLQMQADVPLGAFLSGVDSSLMVALMQEQSIRPVKSFSISFDNAEFDEAPFAKAVAAHIAGHRELYVSSQQAQDIIPKLPNLYDEPFSDSSQIPTYLVSKTAKNMLPYPCQVMPETNCLAVIIAIIGALIFIKNYPLCLCHCAGS